MAEREASIAAIAAAFGEPSDRDVFIAGLALYWAEGAKSKPWRVSDRVTLINSDAAVIGLFLKWLYMLGVQREQLRLRVSIHESADVGAAEQYWSAVTGIGVDQFGRATLKRHNPKTPRYNIGNDYFGCLTIDVCKSRQLYQSIEGWWRALAGAVDVSLAP
jgi:hypothetical protein